MTANAPNVVVTSIEQADHYAEVVICLANGGNLSEDETAYLELLRELIEPEY